MIGNFAEMEGFSLIAVYAAIGYTFAMLVIGLAQSRKEFGSYFATERSGRQRRCCCRYSTRFSVLVPWSFFRQ
jgi:hypothetical protein